jgi:hypothetical protein
LNHRKIKRERRKREVRRGRVRKKCLFLLQSSLLLSQPSQLSQLSQPSPLSQPSHPSQLSSLSQPSQPSLQHLSLLSSLLPSLKSHPVRKRKRKSLTKNNQLSHLYSR